MKEGEKIKTLSREALGQLGKEECSVILVNESVTLGGDAVVQAGMNWGVRATDKNGATARVDFDTMPTDSDDKIRRNLIELFSQTHWKQPEQADKKLNTE